MTNKEKIKYLMQYTKLQIEFEHISETYKRLLDSLADPAAKAQVLSHAPSSSGGGGNPIEVEYIRVSMLEGMLQETRNRLVAIEHAINRLDDSGHRTLLRLRYLDGLTWEKICVTICYEWAQTHRIHSEALQKIVLR